MIDIIKYDFLHVNNHIIVQNTIFSDIYYLDMCHPNQKYPLNIYVKIYRIQKKRL
jgi:hypothetical protein